MAHWLRTVAALALLVALAPAQDPVMRVHFIDVGQGDATLLEFPCAAVLVDTGGESTSQFDSDDELEVYLAEFFDRRDDLFGLASVMLTHPHKDHTRGAKMVRYRHHPENVVTNGQTTGSGRADQKFLHQYAADFEDAEFPVGFRAVWLDDIPPTGLTDDVIDPVDCGHLGIDPQITVLWGQVSPRPDGWSKSDFEDENNHSVVVRVDFGEASVLLTGDLEHDAIEDLLVRYEGTGLLDVDLYQVGHHGSSNGTTAELVEAMSPEMAVFSCGPSWREERWSAWQYGHPREDVFGMLTDGVALTRSPVAVPVAEGQRDFVDRDLAAAIYATAWDGTVVIEARMDGTLHVVAPAADPTSDLLDVNSATFQELVDLPRIGEVKAQAILDDRDENGPFESVDDLDRVHGIGPATVQVLREYVRV